jgi:hypothetical protein
MLSEADTLNIAEEIESMGRSEKRELTSRLRILLTHLLQWEHQPQRRGTSWDRTIRNTRTDIADLLADNPSLKPVSVEAMATAYTRAHDDAAAETRLSLKRFPAQCPWTFDQLMDQSFWPGTPTL